MDASPVGLGAVLVQEGRNGQGERIKRPVAFASRALTATEAEYPQAQREALAVVWGVEGFYCCLVGREFNLVVDHQPLALIFEGGSRPDKRVTTRAESCALRLSTCRYKMHVVRSDYNIADWLSRESLLNREPFNDDAKGHELGALTVSVNPEFGSGLQAVTLEDMGRAAREDEVFEMVKRAVETESWPRELQRCAAFQDELSFQGGLLLRGGRVVAPQALRGRLMRAAHLGHPGVVAMRGALRGSVWWPGMDLDIESQVKECHGCTMGAGDGPPEPMTRTVLPQEPWECLAIGFNSPNSLGVRLLVVTDCYSRLALVRVMKEADAGGTCDQLEDLFATCGYPACLRADNGPPFASAEFRIGARSGE